MFMNKLLSAIIISNLFSTLSLDPGINSKSHKKSREIFDDDDRDSSVLSGLIKEFMSDSKMLLIADMDLFWDVFAHTPSKLQKAVQTGDEFFSMKLLEYMNQLKEYDISTGCMADIGHFLWSSIQYARWLQNLSCQNCSCSLRTPAEHQWIFNVIDAFGKPPAGVLGGNNLWIGSWSECKKISVVKNRQGQKWSGQYCMARFHPYNRDNPLKNIGSDGVQRLEHQCKYNEKNETNDDDDECFDLLPLLNYGLCSPDSCTSYDVKKIIDLVYQISESAIGRKVVCNVEVVCTNNLPESQILNDSNSLLVLFFVSFIAIIMIFGTLYDYIIYQELVKNVNAKQFYSQQSWFIKLFLSFSVYTNGKAILRTDRHEKQIHCLHGMRVLSMFWIILGHSYYYLVTSLTLDNLLPTLIGFPQEFFNLIIVQATLAVDSFFYLSGMLTCYLFMQKFTLEHAKGRSVFSPVIWLLFYIHRYIRLTPVYLVIMLLEVTLFTYVGEGPFWRPIEQDYCRKNWWTNMVYMNNFLMQDVPNCMGWTWYLANDMQFHCFAPIFLILLFKSEMFGVCACLLTIITSTVAHLSIVLSHDYPPAPLLTAKLQIVKDLEQYWPNVYIKPYIRCIPYLVGLLTGFLLHKTTLNPVFSQWKIVLGWSISTALGLMSVFSLFSYAQTGEISTVASIAYIIFGRSGYAFSIAWVAFACATGYGGPIDTLLSWRAWIPLSRITFCAYLIHPILIQVYHLSRPHPFHFTATYQMIYLFAVAVVMAYFVGFFLSLAFEVPVSILENLIVDKIMEKLRGAKKRKLMTIRDEGTCS